MSSVISTCTWECKTNQHVSFQIPSYRQKALEMAFGKKPIVCKLSNLEEATSVYTQTNALTGKKFTSPVHRGTLAFMAPDLMFEELLRGPTETAEIKTVDVWTALRKFFTLLNPAQFYQFQNDLKNILNKVTSNTEAALIQESRSKLILPLCDVKVCDLYFRNTYNITQKLE